MPTRFTRFDVVAHGTIYRDPSGLQAYYPRIVRLGEKEFLASFVASVENETPDSHPELSRSTDGGTTWTLQGPLDQNRPAECPPTETGFISMDAHGSLLCLAGRWLNDPAEPDLPLIHPKTIGMRENQMILRRSTDGGRSWTAAQIIPKPFPVPLEISTGVVTLADGTNIITFATWKGWDGSCPYGHRVGMVRSVDRCKAWSVPVDIFYDPTDCVAFWEGHIVQMSGDTLLATCWAHEWDSDQDLPNHFALSHDAGHTWTAFAVTPVMGQTGWPLWLGDDEIIFVYNHRRPPAGVRAQLARIVAGQWITVSDEEVWAPEKQHVGSITREDYGVGSFQFGAPSAISLGGDEIMFAYWCVENERAGINWSLAALR